MKLNTVRLSSVQVLGVSFLCAAVACGGSTPPASSPSETTGATDAKGKESHEHEHDGKEHHEHDDLPPALKDFHGVIAPVWHSTAGATRVGKACESTKAIIEKADATGDAELKTAAKDLEGACAKDGKPEVEAKLSTVHDRFHALMKAQKH